MTSLVPVSTPARRPWLSSSLRGELERAGVATSGTGVAALQTHADAAPSYPLVAFLKAASIPWVTEGPDGDLHEVAAAAVSEAPVAGPGVGLYGSVLHAATGDLVLGKFTTRMLAAAGCSPAFMGAAEPLQQPWDAVALTAWLRPTMPLGIALVSGEGFAGIVTAYRTEAGVLESFDVLMAARLGGVRLPERSALGSAAVDANAQGFGMDLHFGAVGLRVPAGRDALRVPQLLVLGPSLHKGGAAVADGHAGVDVEVLGNAPFQHLAIRYPAASSWDGGEARGLRERILNATSAG
ncbi:DUF6177 family protein [Paenarthrobacter sp. NPDC056912]|uniref:DUF6177 family protein n=1 Tax=Paenarthrobacter sp. NPDC056912 TaxID=3345965 RepID=UPI00366ACA4A